MKITHSEHGTRMATEGRTLRGTVERHLQWQNRTLSFEPGPTRFTFSLGIFMSACYGLFSLVLAFTGAVMVWFCATIDFLPGEIISAIWCAFFSGLTLMMGFTMLKATMLLILTKRGKSEDELRGLGLASPRNPHAH